MIERLGTVIYYLCSLSAAGIFIAGFFVLIGERGSIQLADPAIWVLIGFCALIYLVGFVVNYVLTGRKWA